MGYARALRRTRPLPDTPPATLDARCGTSDGFEMVNVPPRKSGYGRGSKSWSSVGALNARDASANAVIDPFSVSRTVAPARGDQACCGVGDAPKPLSSTPSHRSAPVIRRRDTGVQEVKAKTPARIRR